VLSPSKSTLLSPVWENQALDLKPPHFTSTLDSVTMHWGINYRAIESRGEAYNLLLHGGQVGFTQSLEKQQNGETHDVIGV
jgi:hypothetical protein